MSAHQVVIGALNPNENCYSIGSVDGLNFIACAVGSDVVILASDFQRIQVVPGSAYKREEIVSSINCCADSGKVSVCYGSTIRILEPALSDGKSGNIFSYRWVESQSIELDAIVDSVQWVLDGLRLLVLADCDLLLYQHKMLSTADSAWEIVWRTKLSSKVKYVKFSPDGSLFATCGENDRFVKIWYQERGTYAFSFIYIQHPAPVCGFEWRQTGRYMPRKFVQNTIITWCEDSTARIWKEIPNKDSNQAESLIEAAAIVTHEKQRRKKFTHRHFHLKKTKSRLVTKLTNLMNDKKSPTRTLAGSVLMPSGMIRSSTLADFAVPATTNTVVFCLIASINAENDCFLVPSMNPLSRSNRPFTVHWLNNKELVFTAGAERILAEALLSESAEKGDSTSTRASHNGDHSRGISPIGGTMISSSAPSMDLADVPGEIAVPTTPTPSPTHDDTPQRWSKSYDVLFSIHPVDGSLLTWTLEWIDDSWHQASNRDRFGTSLLSTILLLTSHENGSLNLWRMTMDENRLSTIVNIVHESRMCGHRFHISQVVPHPTLPLLVTASQFSPAKETVRSAKEAELILWKVSPVGPLCKSGGVRELARVTSHSENAFACISWVPAILPSSVLGTVCNSPSSLFVASNNGHLSMATGDLHNGRELSKGPLSETFHVVSTQSTAKPGCVLYVDDIDNSDHSPNEILLLHIFDEELVVSNAATKASAGAKESSRAEDDSESSPPQITFHGKYLVVMVVRSEGMDRLRMWSINVNAEQSLLVTDANKNAKDNSQFYPAAVPIPASSAKLMIQSEKVYDQPIDFGSDIQVTSCVVSAGHLPSASLYPACRAPYTLLLVCSDDQIRFLRCVIDPSNSKMYKWEKWKMINEDIDSSLEMDGRNNLCQGYLIQLKFSGEVYSVSSAYSGRFAVAYRSVGAGTMQATSIGKNLELAVYECESSGGVEWLREDTFNLEKCFVPPLSFAMKTNGESIVNILGDLVNLDTLREWVRIDWVSTEDGSHILTVSQNTAQQNIVMMKEHETGKRAPLRKSSSLAGNTYGSSRLVKWMCIRTLELQSADGLPPLPTAMSWVRDGLLIVGMNSEMRVYNQWNLSTKLHQTMFESTQPHQLHHHKAHSFKDSATADEGKDSNAANSLAPSVLNISRSHSMLDQLSRKQVDHVTSTKMIKEIMNRVLSASKLQDLNVQEGVLEAISEEGLFEASRLSSPMLPQYHPKQLIEMLNAGKTKRVKAHRQVSVPNPLSRAASIRKMTMAGGSASREQPIDVSMQRRSSVAMAPMDEIEPDPYDELDTIAPLPLYSLFAADNASTVYQRTEDLDQNNTQTYDNLFNGQESDDDLDDMLDDIVQNKDRSGGKTNKSRTRHSSGSSELIPQSIQQSGVPTSFTSRHSRVLTELLTHTHLPGLSSVDQMHLLAIADTISHFSSSGVMEKLTHANAALQSVTQTSTLGDSSAAGYASASMVVCFSF
ncbi:dmX-like protein 1 [Ditylenchus destructor]|nr:dmX-like protein 1 [Ditylenchus destructor]